MKLEVGQRIEFVKIIDSCYPNDMFKVGTYRGVADTEYKDNIYGKDIISDNDSKPYRHLNCPDHFIMAGCMVIKSIKTNTLEYEKH